MSTAVSNILPPLTRRSQLKAHKTLTLNALRYCSTILTLYISLAIPCRSVILQSRFSSQVHKSWVVWSQNWERPDSRLAGVEYFAYTEVCCLGVLVERFQAGRVVGLVSSARCAVCLYYQLRLGHCEADHQLQRSLPESVPISVDHVVGSHHAQ